MSFDCVTDDVTLKLIGQNTNQRYFQRQNAGTDHMFLIYITSYHRKNSCLTRIQKYLYQKTECMEALNNQTKKKQKKKKKKKKERKK